MKSPTLPQAYSSLQAWAHDYLIAERALRLHAHILEHGRLTAILAEPCERSLLDVGCGGGQSALRLGMPPGAVSQLPSLPAFIFRTRKPAAGMAGGR